SKRTGLPSGSEQERTEFFAGSVCARTQIARARHGRLVGACVKTSEALRNTVDGGTNARLRSSWTVRHRVGRRTMSEAEAFRDLLASVRSGADRAAEELGRP